MKLVLTEGLFECIGAAPTQVGYELRDLVEAARVNPGDAFRQLVAVSGSWDPKFYTVRLVSGYDLVLHVDDESALLCWLDVPARAREWASERHIGPHGEFTNHFFEIQIRPKAGQTADQGGVTIQAMTPIEEVHRDELERAIKFPWERWMIFLHPVQERAKREVYQGPVAMSGPPGSGKTVVCLHRAAHLLMQNPEAEVLLTTFSRTLAGRLRESADLLLGTDTEQRQRLRIEHLHQLAMDYLRQAGEQMSPLTETELTAFLNDARSAQGQREFQFENVSSGPLTFLKGEWESVIDANMLQTEDEYLTFERRGRGSRLSRKERADYWRIFQAVRARCLAEGRMTWNQLCVRATALLQQRAAPPFTHVIADEAQDFSPVELRFLRALVAPGQDDLFLAADRGQQIFAKARHTTWRAGGIDVPPARSKRLECVYRSTEEIYRFTAKLLKQDPAEAAGGPKPRALRPLLRGPEPTIERFDRWEREDQSIASWLREQRRNGLMWHEMAVFAPVKRALEDVAAVMEQLEIPVRHLSDRRAGPRFDAVALATMHAAKGLEYRAVAVMRVSRDVMPNKTRLAELAHDPEEQLAFIDEERHLLYVACSRARERLLVTYCRKPSELLLPVLTPVAV
ncbi:MAG: UvrD-helicase domain-containing protein [bacterium]